MMKFSSRLTIWINFKILNVVVVKILLWWLDTWACFVIQQLSFLFSGTTNVDILIPILPHILYNFIREEINNCLYFLYKVYHFKLDSYCHFGIGSLTSIIEKRFKTILVVSCFLRTHLCFACRISRPGLCTSNR